MLQNLKKYILVTEELKSKSRLGTFDTLCLMSLVTA